MPGTLQNLLSVAPNGLTPAYTAAVASMAIPNVNGNTVVHIKNGSGVAVNATIRGQGLMGDVLVPDRVVAIPAGQERMIGRLNPALYNQSDGTVQIDLSAVATVTVAVVAP